MRHFIHIPKTGGMTLRRAPQLKGKITLSTPDTLKSKQYHNDLVRFMTEQNEATATEHARWRDLNENVQQTRQFFAIVRNPWNRVASRYNFMVDMWTNNKGTIRQQKQYKMPMSFEEFIDWRHDDGELPFFWHRAIRNWYTQKDHVTDVDGSLKVECLRLESSDVEQYFGLTQPLRKRNISNFGNVDYSTFYNEKTIQIVADWYKDDIEFFGFDFDTPAQRNTVFT